MTTCPQSQGWFSGGPQWGALSSSKQRQPLHPRSLCLALSRVAAVEPPLPPWRATASPPPRSPRQHGPGAQQTTFSKSLKGMKLEKNSSRVLDLAKRRGGQALMIWSDKDSLDQRKWWGLWMCKWAREELIRGVNYKTEKDYKISEERAVNISVSLVHKKFMSNACGNFVGFGGGKEL